MLRALRALLHGVLRHRLLVRVPVLAQWAEVFVDGKLAQHRVLHGPSSTETYVGFAQRMGSTGGEKAFCFSMPRPVFEVAGQSSIEPEQDPEKLADIGSVRIDVHRTYQKRKGVESVGGRFRGADGFEPTDKKTAKSLGSTAAVRAGNAPPCSLLACRCIHFAQPTKGQKPLPTHVTR